MSTFLTTCSLLLVLPLFAVAQKTYNIAIVPKNLNNAAFFDLAFDGCQDAARLMSEDVNCWYNGTWEVDVPGTIEILDQLIEDDDCSAIAVSVLDPIAYIPAINRAIAANKPIFTFDSDAPGSDRLSYIGTNNYLMGRGLGKLLDESMPEGGTYGMVSGFGDNLAERVRGVRERLNGTNWVEVEGVEPKNGMEDIAISLQRMYEWVEEFPDIDSVVGVVGIPMFNSSSVNWIEFVQKNPQIKTIMADTIPVQLEIMQKGYADGLVGQLPYVMGYQAAESSMNVIRAAEAGKTSTTQDIIYSTHQLEVLRVPTNSSRTIVEERPPVDLSGGTAAQTSFEKLSLRFEGVTQELSQLQLGYFEDALKEWFEEFYAYQEIEAIQVGEVDTDISVVSQEFMDSSLTITFDQVVGYIALERALVPRDYLSIPFLHSKANYDLATDLKIRLGTGFAGLKTPLSLPKMHGEGSDDDGAESKGLSAGGLAAIVAVATFVLTMAIAAGVYYKFLKQPESSASKDGAEDAAEQAP